MGCRQKKSPLISGLGGRMVWSSAKGPEADLRSRTARRLGVNQTWRSFDNHEDHQMGEGPFVHAIGNQEKINISFPPTRKSRKTLRRSAPLGFWFLGISLTSSPVVGSSGKNDEGCQSSTRLHSPGPYILSSCTKNWHRVPPGLGAFL